MQLPIALLALLSSPAADGPRPAALPLLTTSAVVAASTPRGDDAADAEPEKKKKPQPKPAPEPTPSPKPAPEPCPTCGMG